MPERSQSAQSERRLALLACLENAVRLAIAAGATHDEIRESVAWAFDTPEREAEEGS